VTLTKNTLVERNPEIVHTDMDGEVVMMSIEQGAYYGVDSIGSRIWNMLEEQTSIGDLCSRLCQLYDVGAEQCQQDVIHFLEEMAEHQIIKIS